MSNVQKTMNAVITTGEYTNNQGETKKKYLTVGTLFVYQDGGLSLKIEEGITVSGNINFYERDNKNNQQQGQGQQQQGGYNQQQGGQVPVEYQNANGQPMQQQQNYNQYQ